MRESRVEKKEFLVQYKGGKCQDCGSQFPLPCYDFDHRDPATKSFTISSNYNLSLTELLSEADKCDLVCANCHRIRTANSPAIRTKLSAAQMGKPAWNKGKKLPPFSQEHRDNIAKAKIGNINSLGCKHSPEAIARRIVSVKLFHARKQAELNLTLDETTIR